MFGEPISIAAIHPDLTGTYGEVFASDVFAVSTRGKRKRSETAVAIDRQGVNIYDLRSSRLVTSYVISSQATFTCPPCSFRCRSSVNQAVQRRTYCSVSGLKPRILCFVEEIGQGSPTQDISTCSIDLESASPVLRLDTASEPISYDANFPRQSLFAVHKDGQVSCYGPNLEKILWSQWTFKASTKPSDEPNRIRYAVILGEEQATKAILKQRDDVIMRPPAERSGERILLFTIESNSMPHTADKSTPSIKLYTLDTIPKVNTGLSPMPALQELLSHELPSVADFGNERGDFLLHAASGTLYENCSEGVAIYDLQGFNPRLAQQIPLASKSDNTQSSLRLSSTLLATATNSTIQILGLPFCSLQASMRTDGAPKKSAQRHEPDVAQHSTIHKITRLLSYSNQHNVLIAMAGHDIFSVPITRQSIASQSRKRNRDGLLIGSLGRNHAIQSSQAFQPPATSTTNKFGQRPSLLPDDPAWNQRRTSLDLVLDSGDKARFERALIDELDTTNSASWQNNIHKVSYLLSRIFKIYKTEDVDGNSDSQLSNQLEIAFWPTKVCQWLIRQGLLVMDKVVSALQEYGLISSSSGFVPGALVNAIAKWDPTLTVLQSWLASPTILSAAELGCVLSFITHRIAVAESAGNSNLITDGEVPMSPNGVQALQKTNGDIQAPETSDNEKGMREPLFIAKKVLYSTLRRLKSCSSYSVTPIFRKTMGGAEMRSLINILRVEMAEQGWLSLCAEEHQNGTSMKHTDDQMTLIAHALTILLDSLGPTGWMLGHNSIHDLDEATNTIAYMKAEVSAALEGIEEATYLRQILGEMLLCGKGSLRPPSQKALMHSNYQASASQLIRPTTIPMGEESNLLPLGLKLKPKIPKTKVGAGGEIIQRSQRDIGRLKSRQVGRYSFERIEL